MCFRGLAFKEYFFNPPKSPYMSGNRFVRCGKTNVFRRGESPVVAVIDC